MTSAAESSTIVGSTHLQLVETPENTRQVDILEGVPVAERFETCYQEADRLWRAAIEAEESGRTEECGVLYDEAHQWYISAVWHDSSQNSKVDYMFYLKLANTEVGVARYGNHEDHPEYEQGRQAYFFELAERSYNKAERLILSTLDPAEAGILQSIIFSQRADLHITRGIVDTYRQSAMLSKAKHDLEEAEGCIRRGHTAIEDTGVSERIQMQRETIAVIEAGEVRVRRIHPRLSALLVGAETSQAVAA